MLATRKEEQRTMVTYMILVERIKGLLRMRCEIEWSLEDRMRALKEFDGLVESIKEI